MGQIICPDGSSVQSDNINGSVPYEYLLLDIKSECRTNEYRARCIRAIGEVGLFNHTKDVGAYLHRLMAETESDVIKAACKDVISKHKIRKKREKLNEINEYLKKFGVHC